MSQSSSTPPVPPRFTGDEAGSFDLATAAQWTAHERRIHPDEETYSYFFGRCIIERILAQPGCMGLRVYYATNPSDEKRHLLIVGADAKKNDQLPRRHASPRSAKVEDADPAKTPRSAKTEAIIAEMAIPCPNQCGKANPLNSDQA